MRRRTVGLLLVTGVAAAGVALPELKAQDPAHAAAEAALVSVADADFRRFASRNMTDALAPALKPAIDEIATRQGVKLDLPAEATVDRAATPPPVRAGKAPAVTAQASAKPGAAQQPGVAQQTPPAAAAAAPQPAVTVTPSQPTSGAQHTAPTGASWPKTLPEAKAEAEALANPEAAQQSWPQAEIELAKARCMAVLKGIDAVTIPEPAMRHGDCGTPAPVRLVSIGRNPEVALSPPPVLTCDMVVALHTWVKTDLQPLAKKYLGAPLIKIETMSDYSCRNAYGRTKSRLSEHGKANALDIRGFVTAKGDPAMLLADWGPTARDVAAQIALAKAEAEKKAREKAAADAAAIAARAKDKGQPPRAPGTSIGTTPSELAAQPGGAAPALGFRDGGASSDDLPKVRLTIPGAARDGDDDKPRGGSAFGVDPSRLGGPLPPRAGISQPSGVTAIRAEKDAGKDAKAGSAAAAPAAAPHAPAQAPAKGRTPIVHAPASSRDQTSGKAKFLREAHASGCRIFGTILGPEANNAHRNHLHVDMAERKTTNFCE